MKKLIPLLVVFGLIAVPMTLVLAQGLGTVPDLPGPDATSITAQGGIVRFICMVFSYAFFALLLAAVGFVLYAAYNYLTSGGDPGKVATANKTLIFAAVAVAVALLARAVPVIIGNFFLTNPNSSAFDVCSY